MINETIPKDVFSNWDHKWFGWWKEMGDAYSSCPSITDFIDESWEYEHRAAVAEYLIKSPVIACTSKLSFPCLLGNDDNTGSLCAITDGQWYWLDDLSHYILYHNVRLPDIFLAHIERQGFRYLTGMNVDEMNLQLDRPPIK